MQDTTDFGAVMKNLNIFSIIVFLFFSPSVLALEISESQALEFAQNYHRYVMQADPKVAQLIDNKAFLHGKTTYQNGNSAPENFITEKVVDFIIAGQSFLQYKQEAVSFSSHAVEIENGKVIIRAERFSESNCYIDDGYYLAVQRDAYNFIKVIEEYVEFEKVNNCQEL